MKMKWMVLGQLCEHTGHTGPGEPPEDGAMNALQTLDSKFEPWQFKAEYANSRSRKLPTILNIY